MKKHVNFVRKALALGLVAITLATSPNLTVFAKNDGEVTESTTIDSTSTDTLDMSESTKSGGGFNPEFVPFRSSYASYLASYSGVDSRNVRKIWEKVFWEENNWNSSHSEFYDSKYSKWSDKYYCNYLFKGEEKSSQGIKYSDLPGDFEGFFGNSVKCNKTFLGELFGLPGYEKPSETNNEVNTLMTNLICSYLKNPAKYPTFAKKIAELTADGTYIGTGMGTEDNELMHNDYDKLVLATIAYFYEGDGSEAVLSDKQVTWLKSYQPWLFTEYTTKSSRPSSGALPTDKKSFAATYKPIYELLVMSEAAANSTNSTHPAQEFFDYAEASTSMKAGAFLALVKNINNYFGADGINKLDNLRKVNSLETSFVMSSGWCYGHMANDATHPCYYEIAEMCKPHAEGTKGRATENDETMYYLYKCGAANKFITGNSKVYKAYSDPNSTDGGWLQRYNLKHPIKGSEPADTYNDTADIVSGGYAYGHGGGGETCWEGAHTSADGYGTAYITLKKIDEVKSDQPLSRVQKVTISISKLRAGDWNYGSMDTSSWGYTINGVDKTSSGKISRNGDTFDIHKLTWSERQNCVIYINIHVHGDRYANPYDDGDGKPHCRSTDVYAEASTSPTAALEIKRSDCALKGCDYVGTPKWKSDYSGAYVDYHCVNDVKHVHDNVYLESTKVDKGDYYEYTITSPYTYKKDGSEDTYTARVYKTPGKTSETISFSSANTAGILSASAVGTDVWYPEGSKSKQTWKASECAMTMGTADDLIYPGAKTITLHYSYSNELIYLSMTLYSSTGEILATNDLGDNVLRLNSLGDSELDGCYLKVSAKAKTQNWTDNYAWWNGIQPADAYSRISVSGMTIGY